MTLKLSIFKFFLRCVRYREEFLKRIANKYGKHFKGLTDYY